jgi:hypothetical protein
MTHVTIVRERFSNWEDAAAARDRLTDHGFARNRIDIRHVEDEVELTIHTQPHHRKRAEQAIHESWWSHSAHRSRREIFEHAPSRGQTFLLFGALAATGAALWWAFSRNTQDWYQRQSSPSRNDERRFRSDTEFSRFEDRRFMATDRDSRIDREHTATTATATSAETPSGSSMTGGRDAERLPTGVSSDDERLRTDSNSAPLGATAGPSSAGGLGSAASTASTRSPEGVGVGNGSRSIR